MKIDLKRGTMLLAGFGALAAALFAYSPGVPNIKLIDRLDASIQKRFQDPDALIFGMSRIASPSSLGEHLKPISTAKSDFTPTGSAEVAAVGALEEQHVQVAI